MSHKDIEASGLGTDSHTETTAGDHFVAAVPGQIDITPEIDEIAELSRKLMGHGEKVKDDGPNAPWRQGFPYDAKMSSAQYDREKRKLQIELLKLQAWVKEKGEKIVILFEGRDAAGKGGAIKRFTEHMNPRGARVVALEIPTEREKSQWYFQRYAAHLPTAGEIVMFDRSWYNRAGVERVMGYCTPQQYLEFTRSAPEFERMLVNSGIHLIKFWFSVGKAEQHARFVARGSDEIKQWKLSPTDLTSLDKWDDYTEAKEAMFFLHRHSSCSVDGREVKRQEASPPRGDALGARAFRLPQQGSHGRRHARRQHHRLAVGRVQQW